MTTRKNQTDSAQTDEQFTEPLTYSKRQFLDSSTYAEHRDVLAALLQDDQLYSHEQVEQLLGTFRNAEVK
ncbi:hypothetical protein [Paenibacillus sp. YYML68]|uniref:hypothetical protein n=1 Tax=Paenibacillus sp. YYML68 TaxID=2909250 RepID=UPI0024924F7D|nr:hypothetical protein [Paenibacillus sp. YYML68]